MRPELTAKELQAYVLSLELGDAEMGAAGASAAIPMAAMLLARQTHAPDLQIAGEMFVNPRPKRLYDSMLDDRALGACEAAETFLELFGHSHRGLDFFFHNGMQVDAYGNINLHHIGGTIDRPRMRGPGRRISPTPIPRRGSISAPTCTPPAPSWSGWIS
ncbi:MAG: hypothetical protein ACU0CX_13695 [Sagittula sp.]|uniref:hypothetical protein n=1 Tax=Sagittula sp. TaxID=2038081 RepID=UPI004059FB08